MLFVPVQAVLAAGITVGAGGSFSVGSGSVDVGCGDVQLDGALHLNSGGITRAGSVLINGTLQGNSGTLQFGNDWVNNGTVVPGTSIVSLTDECGDGSSAIVGNSAFWDLAITSFIGKIVSFEAGSTTAVGDDIVFAGVDGNLLTLQSSVSNQPWLLLVNLAATQFVDWVAVGDSIALGDGQHMAPGPAYTYNSVSVGGIYRWFAAYNVEPIPTLSAWGAILMIGGVMLIALMRRRRVL